MWRWQECFSGALDSIIKSGHMNPTAAVRAAASVADAFEKEIEARFPKAAKTA
jgi:hypothetical protein